jgi:hypothetical protein
VRKVRCCGKYRVRAIIIILKKRKRKESVRVQQISAVFAYGGGEIGKGGSEGN